MIFKEITPLSAKDCFTVFSRTKEEFTYPIHTHDEYELNYIENAQGAKRVVGDSIEYIDQLELTLITGSNLRHAWLNSEKIITRPREIKEITIQFHNNLLNDELLLRNQFRSIRELFDKATYGVTFSIKSIEQVRARLFSMSSGSQGLHSVLTLFSVLYDLSLSSDMRVLSSLSFSEDIQGVFNSQRVDKAYQYILSNYQNNITLQDVANQVNMSSTGFSRFVKERTGKNFIDILNDVRITQSIRLLMDTAYNISEICYSCGFSNLSNFNRIFKKKKGCTPSQFRQNYQGKRILL